MACTIYEELDKELMSAMLTIVDVYTRESVAIEVGQSLKGEDVVRTLNRLETRTRCAEAAFL